MPNEDDQPTSSEDATQGSPKAGDRLAEEKPRRTKSKTVSRPYPRRNLQDAISVPTVLKEKNGGHPLPPSQVGTALNLSMSSRFFYLAAASRDFGLTSGGRDSAEIAMTDLGRRVVSPTSPEDEKDAYLEAFFKVDLFERVVRHFGGSKLPEEKFLSNILSTTFGLEEEAQEEFIKLFNENCRFLSIGEEFGSERDKASIRPSEPGRPDSARVATVATQSTTAPTCFIIMPFSEKNDSHAIGFFDEVLASLFTPAAASAGFEVRTAKKQGSDVIQATIVTELLAADLVLADLTEHNPNVLFELGMRMAEEKPIALVRAKGTGAIFDVDNMLRVAEYNPNLWASTVEKDIPRIAEHLLAAWENRATDPSFLSILRRVR